ncbi:MOSC domain-containing protein [Amycolatopsis sp. K13G38]|uniref:MOSC domain-containing protein n=1 Tax=Amycolatopsis acididurans TaxID=2724524 RepID=A0ABX1JEB8_9PSEU|nr:MOSC N-terminal beta barrel domain-containing protein [Amycolatopsis acididurans]NKQ58083.1 MOSC domain-containing protein [Amycolatopsis acididurans]
MFEGTVAGLNRWPVKSLRGERVAAARFDDRGMAGDRAFALIDQRDRRRGSVLTVRQNPAMLTWRSFYDDEPVAYSAPPALRGPDGTKWSWTDPGVAGALSASLGIPLELRAADGMQDRGPTVLVTFEASRVALERELGAPVDLDRFRTNMHLELDAPAFAEEDWGEDTRITVGEVELTATGKNSGPCIRCAVPSWDAAGRERWPKLQTWLIEQHENKFGMIMRVTRAGVARVGEAASVQPVL